MLPHRNIQEELKTLNYENFIKSRHSIRHFGSEAVDVELLREAIQIAQYTPSACNRQGWVIRIVESKDAIDTILENQMVIEDLVMKLIN